MSTHVPSTKDADLTALNYFIAHQSESGAALAWTKLKVFETKPQERFNYIEYLIARAKPHEAADVFMFPASADATPFFNASFETEPVNGGFDWRFASSEHAEARRDTAMAKDGLASWLVTFDGKENVDYMWLIHFIPVTKGRHYDVSFWMKTEAISTNEGVFVEADGQPSEKQVGTTYWQQFTIPFTASNDMVAIRLRRVPSKKFDNQIKGKVWLDAFSISER
jgi:hypothetical protein